MRPQLLHKVLPLLAAAVMMNSCAVSSTAVRPSFGGESYAGRSARSEDNSTVTSVLKTVKTQKKRCFSTALQDAELPVLSEGSAEGGYVEGDPDSYYSESRYDNTPGSIISEASKYLGVRYRSGGTGPDGFDCSGYVWKVYSSAGIGLPRASSADYYSNGEKIDRDEAVPGDMIFFRERGRINHVGIFLGDDKFIHSSSGRGVIESSMSEDFWKHRIAGFRRFGS